MVSADCDHTSKRFALATIQPTQSAGFTVTAGIILAMSRTMDRGNGRRIRSTRNRVGMNIERLSDQRATAR
jgi:hypothetical protein